MLHWSCSCTPLKNHQAPDIPGGRRPVSSGVVGALWALGTSASPPQPPQLLELHFRIRMPSDEVGVYGRVRAAPKPSRCTCLPNERCLPSFCRLWGSALGPVRAQLGGGPRSAVCSVLPATPISSNIRLLLSNRYNIIPQPSRQAEFAAMAIMTAGSLHTKPTAC